MKATLLYCRHFAKKTLLKTARKAGIKSKPSTHKQKYVLPTPPMLRKNISPRSSDSESERPNSEIFDDLSSKNITVYFVVGQTVK